MFQQIHLGLEHRVKASLRVFQQLFAVIDLALCGHFEEACPQFSHDFVLLLLNI